MNKLIQMSQNWHYRSQANKYGTFSKLNKIITTTEIQNYLVQLNTILNFWNTHSDLITGTLISVYYPNIIPKTPRIQRLFSPNLTDSPNDSVVGIRYLGNDDSLRHVFTYHVQFKDLKKTISVLEEDIIFISHHFNNQIDNNVLNIIEKNPTKYFKNKSVSKRFAQRMADLSYISKFDIFKAKIDSSEQKIVSLYDLNKNSSDIKSTQIMLKKIGIDKPASSFLSKNVVLLDTKELKILSNTGSFLVYMETKDLFNNRDSYHFAASNTIYEPLPEPTNEPTIGVIDTVYKKADYFKEWVEYENDFKDNLNDKQHGNKVTSIIVAGPKFNPLLEDNCGYFKVHHFGISHEGKDSSFRIIQRIQEIVESHPEINVWNLSLGSPYSSNINNISSEAAVLDKLQAEHPNLLFIIAGTNLVDKSDKDKKYNRIGAPADSINSLVINSVSLKNNKKVDYARKGPVLRYFVKPDVSYYGGDQEQPLFAATSLGQEPAIGTSFAAPWIARKASFLIDKMHLSRETAKALIIDSASGWLNKNTDANYVGYGVVPIKIEDVINCASDEIKFVITGSSKKSITYSDEIPIPINAKNQQPFIAKATLVYFPNCSQNQGVDYTNTELSLQFGRIDKGKIRSINNDNSIEKKYIPEASLRRNLGKWENVKIKGEKYTPKKREKKVADKGFWGIKLTSSERLYGYKQQPFNFSIVITLKNIKGQNLNEQFKQLCRYYNWQITDIDINQRLHANIEGEAQIKWDD